MLSGVYVYVYGIVYVYYTVSLYDIIFYDIVCRSFIVYDNPPPLTFDLLATHFSRTKAKYT